MAIQKRWEGDRLPSTWSLGEPQCRSSATALSYWPSSPRSGSHSNPFRDQTKQPKRKWKFHELSLWILGLRGLGAWWLKVRGWEEKLLSFPGNFGKEQGNRVGLVHFHTRVWSLLVVRYSNAETCHIVLKIASHDMQPFESFIIS